MNDIDYAVPILTQIGNFYYHPQLAVLSLRRVPLTWSIKYRLCSRGLLHPAWGKSWQQGAVWGDGPSTLGVDVFGKWWSQRLCQTSVQFNQVETAKCCSPTSQYLEPTSQNTPILLAAKVIATSVSQHALRSITQDMATRKVRESEREKIQNPPTNRRCLPHYPHISE